MITLKNTPLGITSAEKRTVGNREFLVFPVVPLVTGVHNGWFYDDADIAKATVAWNGVPVTVDHPRDEEGDFTSANAPHIFDQYVIGRMYNVMWSAAEHKLRGELFLDEELIQNVDPQVLEFLQSGTQLEVSTGLFADELQQEGVWNGEEYLGRLVNHIPDHLALLPRAEGACNWQDGCGVRANVRSSARTPSFDGTESTSWAGVSKTFGAYRDAYYKSHGGKPDDPVSSVADAPAAMKNWIAGKTLLGEGSADNERDLLFFPVVNPGTDKLNEGALRAVIGGRGSQANIPEASKTSAQNKARSLLNKHFDANLEVNKDGAMNKVKQAWLVLTGAIGKLFQNEASHEDVRAALQQKIDAMDNESWVHFVVDVYDTDFVYQARGNNPSDGGAVVKLYKQDYKIDAENAVSFDGDPIEVQEKREYIPTGNQQQGVDNKEVHAMEEIKKLVDALVANEKSQFVEEDREWLVTQELVHLQKMAPCAAEKEPEPVKEQPTPEADPPTPDASGPKPQTLEEYVNAAPPEVRETLQRSVARDKEVKADLVKELLANKRCPFTQEQLAAKPISELEALAKLADVKVDYSGRSGGPVQANQEEPLATPKVWDKV